MERTLTHAAESVLDGVSSYMDIRHYEPQFVTQPQDVFFLNLLFSFRTCCSKLRKLLKIKQKLKQLLILSLQEGPLAEFLWVSFYQVAPSLLET